MKKLLSVALLAIFLAVAAVNSLKFNADYKQRFLQMYNMIHGGNGYFNADGVPYHSVETLICEAPDYGHLTTSEAYSYYIWLETMYGAVTGNWDNLNTAYKTLEKYAIPDSSRQPTNDAYNPSSPANFAPEGNKVSDYPETLTFNCQVGEDPLHDQLKNAYGTTDIYGTHWLFDADNWYQYGMKSDGSGRNGAINTFQRGPDEGVWKTIPQPEWETFKWGGPNGFLDLFTRQPPPYSPQWRYTNAPDADARIVQAMYWAYTFASQNNNQSQIPSAQASKLGDYLRYSMFDKYFKTIGSQTPCGANQDWYGGYHGLISWYYAWGGYLPPFQYPWGFRIGCEYAHFGYQNPIAAYTLSKVQAFEPKSSNGAQDWATSLDKQLDFYAWLQSAEGAIAGGATSSWNGRYDPYPTGTSTFNKMAYMNDPSYRDPPSNQWFGWQCWSMERLAEFYYVTGDGRAANILNKWLPWAKSVLSFNGTLVNGPGTLDWSGQPDPWTGTPTSNSNLHVTVSGTTNDVGVMSSLAHTFTFIAAKNNDQSTAQLAQKILDTIWSSRDSKGVVADELRPDYCGNQYAAGFNQTVYVPQGWSGRNAQGAQIQSGMTFLQMRPSYNSDPMLSYVQQQCSAGRTPVFRYHRFWAQAEFAVATADFARLFPNGAL